MATGNLLAIYDSVTDRSGVALSASSGGGTVSRLIDIRPGYKWQATGRDAEWLQADAGADDGFLIDTVALVAHNATTDGMARTRLSNNADMSSPSYDDIGSGSGVDIWPPVYGLGEQLGLYMGGYPLLTTFAQFTYFRVIRLGAQYAGRYLRTDFTDPTNPDGVFKLGRWIAGIGWQPSRNFRFGWQYTWIDPSPLRFTDGGGVIANRKPKYREFTISIGGGGLPLSEALSYGDDMIRTLGTTRPLLLLLFPDGSANRLYRTSVYGLIKSPVAIVGEHPELGSVAQLVIRELK